MKLNVYSIKRSRERLSARRQWQSPEGDPPAGDPPGTPPVKPAPNPETVPYKEFQRVQNELSAAQALVDKNLRDFNNANGTLTQKEQEHQRILSEQRVESERIKAEADGLRTQHASEKTRADKASAELALSKKLLGDPKYSGLLPLFGKGLINTNGLDEAGVSTLLDGLAEQFKIAPGIVPQPNPLGGITPPTPEGQGGGGNLNMTPAQMSDRMMQLDPSSTEYQTISAAYLNSIPSAPIQQ